MTLRIPQRELLAVVLFICFAWAPASPAIAQVDPQAESDQTRPQPRNQEEEEALQRLLELRDKMEKEEREREERGETAPPRTPRTRPQPRASTVRESRQETLAEMQREAQQVAQARGDTPGEKVVYPPADFVGPPASLAPQKKTRSPAEIRESARAQRGETGDSRDGDGESNEPLVRRPIDPDEPSEWFNFNGMPWEDVVMTFVDRIGKPMMGEELIIGGELYYVSDRKFTQDEAIDELNLIMHEQGYRFVEQEHHVRVIPLAEMPQWVPIDKTYPTVAAFNEADPREMDYVTVYYRVPDVKAQALVDMFLDALPDYTRVSTLDESNQIKITALARDVREFLTLKDLVDITPGDPGKLRFFKIETNAREIERLVRGFMDLPSGGGAQVVMERDQRTGRMVPRRVPAQQSGSTVQMVADDRTNQIIVKATEDKLKEIEALIEKFDQKPPLGDFVTKVHEVRHSDAAEIANLLNQIFQQEQGESSRTPNWQRIRALQQAQARARAQRNQRGRNQRQPTRTPTAAQAGSVAPEDILAEGIFERAKKTVRLVADPRLNVLIVYANDEGHKRVDDLLQTLDVPQTDSFQTVAVEHVKVSDIAAMVTELTTSMTLAAGRTGKTPTIVPDSANNVFYIMAERDEMTKIEDLIKRLDVVGSEQNKHVVELVNLRPSDVAVMIQNLLDSGGTRTSGRALSSRIRGRRGVRQPVSVTQTTDYQVIPLDDAGILIVYCTDDDWEKINETIQLWDSRALTSSPVLEVFAIEKGNAETIAATLGQFYRAYQHPVLGRSQVAIQPDGDQIWVYGVQPAIDEIAGLIETMDVEGSEDQTEILPLAYADATQVAQQIQQMFGMGRNVRRGRGVTAGIGPLIQSDPITNSLIVQANKSDLEKIKDYAMDMDQRVGAQEPERRFFTPRHAEARNVASAIQQVYGGVRGRSRQPIGTQVKAIVSGPQVIVEAPKDKLPEIEAFIQQLDDPKGSEIVIKTIKLEGADVGQIASKLNNAFRARRNVVARFDPDATSETILLTCQKDVLDQAQELIDEYVEAARGQAPQVEFRQMTHAQARDAATWLREQLLTYMQQQLGRRAAQAIRVTADQRTNRVVINGPEVAVKFGLTLLEQYDVEADQPPSTPMDTEARKLAGLDVRALANNLNQVFRNEPRRPDGLRATFAYDTTTETLIISAPKDMYARINEIISTFESEAQDVEPIREFFAVQEADANYIAGLVRNLLTSQIGRTRGRAVSDRISISVDTRRNEVIVSAPKFVIPMAAELIERLDQPPTAQNQLRTIPLANADANTVNNVLRQIFNEKIRARTLQISAEPLTNSLIVGGTDEDYSEIEKWAKDLDEQALVKRGTLEIVEVLNASPWEIANILNQQYGGGGWGRRSKIGKEYSFNVVAGRSIAVQAPEDKLPGILELIERLDKVGVDKVEVRTYELAGIGQGIHDLARQVTNAINSQQQARERRVAITAYPAADTLIVTARTDQFEEIEAMMERFKTMVEKETTITKFVKLEHLDAGRYARMIQDMLANKLVRTGRSSRATQNLSIVADARTNRLVCYVPEKIVPDLEQIIAELDVPAEDYEGQVRSIELAHADANTVAQTLRPMFEQRQNQRRREDISQIIVRIQPEAITNSLLVTASDEDFEEIKKQALWLDERVVLHGREPQVVDLVHANASEVANLINQWFGSRGRRGQSEAQQAKATVTNGVLVVSAPRNKMDEIEALIAEVDQVDPSGVQLKTYELKVLNASQVTLAVQGLLRDLGRNARPGQLKPGAFAEPTTNTLVVMAPPESFVMIDKIIAELEDNAPGASAVRPYRLVNVQAEQISRNLDAMLKAKVIEREGSNRRTTVQTSVFAEPITNRVFVYAPEDYQDLAAELVKMVDEEVDTGRIVHIIPLDNGDARELANSLQQILQTGQGGRRGADASQVRITADAGSNSILLAGLPKDVAEVEGWLTELEANSTRVPEFQVFRLENISSLEAYDILSGIFPPSRNPQDSVTITADDYANRLLVTANKRKMRQVETFIGELDVAPDDENFLLGGRTIYFVDISRGSASDIAWDVRAMLPDEDRGGPSIEADWFDEYLIVKCRANEFPQVEQLIRQFERRYKPDAVVRQLSVRGLDMAAVTEYIRARSDGQDNLVFQIPTEKPRMERLIVDVWDDDESPEGAAPKEQAPTQSRGEAPRGSKRGVWHVAPFQRGGEQGDLLDEITDDLLGTQRLASADEDARSPFRPALFLLSPDVTGEDEQQATTQPARPVPIFAEVPAREDYSDIEADADAPGQNVRSPVEKEPTYIVLQDDGTLVVKGERDDVDDIVDAIELFRDERSLGEVIRIFRFKYGDVNAAAEILSIMFDVRQRQIIIPQQQQRNRQQGRDGEDQRRGSMFDQLQGMIGGRQQRGQQGQQQQLRIATDPGHNYLIVKCDESHLPEIHQLLRELDIPPGKVDLKVFQLKNLDAAETAQNIKDILGISQLQQRRGRTPTQRGARGRGRSAPQQQLIEMLQQQMVSVPGVEGGAKIERVEIVPNAVTNSLMVSSPPEVMSVISGIIEELEGLEGRNVVGVYHYPLVNARVDDVLPLLQELFSSAVGAGGGRGGRGGGSPGALGPVMISGDPRSNTIIFTAEGKDRDKVEAQINLLDIEGSVAEVEMYVCQFGDATAIASALEPIYVTSGGGGGRRGGGAPTTVNDVRIIAEAATNTILVWGPPDKRDLIFADIERLDDGARQDIREIDVVFADPEKLAETLMQMFGSAGSTGGRQSRGRRGQPSGGGVLQSGRIMIMGDKDAKKLLVRAPDELFSQIEGIVATLDKPDTQLQLKRFELRYADAETVVELVKSAMMEYMQVAQRTGTETDFDAFTAVADPRTNSVMVVGSEETFLFISQILAAVEVETPEDQRKQFRIFTLEQAQAETVAEAINSFAGGGAAPGGRRGGRGGMPGAGGTMRELNVSAVPETATNSVMVFGRSEDIDKVETMVIAELENSISDRYTIAEVAVENVPPSQVVSFIYQFLDTNVQQAGGGQRGGRRGGSAPGTDTGPQIVPNDNGKTLIVRGTNRQVDEVRELVERFDDPNLTINRTKVIAIPLGQDASALAAEVERIVNDSENSMSEQHGRQPRTLVVGADAFTNTIILGGDQALFGLAEGIIQQLAEVRPYSAVTRVIEFKNLSAEQAEQIINDVQTQQTSRSSNIRSGRPRGSTSGSRNRRSGRRGELWTPSIAPAPCAPLHPRTAAWARPYVGTGTLSPVIMALLSGAQHEDDPPAPSRRAAREALEDELLASAQTAPASDEPSGPARPRSQPPARTPALLPPKTDVMQTLTGVSGSLRGDVSVKAIDAQRIVITGDETDVEFIEQILGMMDQTASPGIIEVFQLESAKATVLAPILEEAISSRIEIMTSSPGPQERFSVNAEARSNSLIVAASERMMNDIADLIDVLDVDKTGEGADAKSVVLQNMRASEAVAILIPTIEQLNTQREVPKEAQVSISAVDRNNSIMIVGTPKDIEEVSGLIEALDVKLTAEEAEDMPNFVTADVIIIPLQNANASDVAETLTTMIEEQQEAARSASGDKAGEPFVKVLRLRTADGRELPALDLERSIKIIPEEGTNSLIIFSTKDNNEALTAIVDVFDTLPEGADIDVKAFRLEYANAEEVADLLEQVFEDKSALLRPSEGDSGGLEKGRMPPVPPGMAAAGLPYPVVVQHDVRSNTVVVIGRVDAVVLAGGLISELDRPTMELGLRAYVLGPLKVLQSGQFAEKLEELLDARAEALGANDNEARDSAVIQPEERSNSLVVFAQPEVYEMIEDLVAELDVPEKKYSVVDMRYRPLRYADAVKIQGLLEEMFQAKEEAEQDTNEDLNDTLTVLADVRSNSLLMTGTRDYLDEAETLITELDQEFDGTVVFEAIKVKLNSAANIAAILEDMVEKALKQSDSALSGTEVVVSADPVSDTLLIAAAREDMRMLKRWVEIMDRPTEVGRMTRIIPLQRGDAEEVAQQAEEIFQFDGQQGQVDLTVTHDPTTNSVIAFGPPPIVSSIEDFVRQLDGVEAAGHAVMRIFKLEQADAEVAGELLTRILEGESGTVGGTGGGGGGSSDDVAAQVMLIWQDDVETLRAMRKDIRVLADVRTNSLFVTAPTESMRLMESLVSTIDVPPDAAKIKVFRLVNADAENMAETLRDLFERDTVAGTGGNESERMLAVEGQGGREEIAFTVDVRTNSVIAAGTSGYLDLVEEIVLELDTIPIEDIDTIVYSPRNLPAIALADSIREFSEAEQQRLEDIGEEISQAVLKERSVTAIANEDANRVIVGVDPRFKNTVMRVVDELDQPPPQVMIQVLIVEVTLENDLDLGVEFAFQDLQYTKAGPTDTTTFDYVGGTDLGAAGSGLGGFTFTITGADFNFLFRTLQSEGSLKVLSRPQIVAMDNKPAKIDVADDVPYVTGTQTSSTGQISTSVARRNVGIVLEVTPRINPDGFVSMEIKQEVSDLTDSTIDVAPGVSSPIFFTREAETNIMVRDNETVVLGGLITSRTQNRETKVPILGDIPGLGALFRSQSDSTDRKELLLVLTPHVIRTVEDYRALSLAERENLSLVPEEMIDNPLMQGLQAHLDDLTVDEYDTTAEVYEARPVPAEQSPAMMEELEPTEEMYGPVRPTLVPQDEAHDALDPNSYDVPLTAARRRVS